MLLLIKDVADVARRGVLNGGILSTLQSGNALYREWTEVILSRLDLSSGSTTLGTCEVSTAPLALGGLATTRRRLLVVVILNVYPVALRFTILPTLLGGGYVDTVLLPVLMLWTTLGTAQPVAFFTSLTSLLMRCTLTVLMLGIRVVLLKPVRGMTIPYMFRLCVRSRTGSRLPTGSIALLRPILLSMMALPK